jgi:hypothetical protein
MIVERGENPDSSGIIRAQSEERVVGAVKGLVGKTDGS